MTDLTALPKLAVPSSEMVFGGAGVACVEPVARWTRHPPAMVIDLSGYGISNPPAGEQPHDRHGTYMNHFSDVQVFGHHHLHAFISAAHRFDCQEIGGYSRRLAYHVAHHPGRDLPMPQIYRDETDFRIDSTRLKDQPIPHIPGNSQFGTPIEPLNWGMWLLQGIPAACDFVQNRTADRYFCYVGRDWQRALLNTIGIPDISLVHQELGHTYHCEAMSVRQYTHVDLAPSPLEREVFAKLAHQLVGPAHAPPSRKIYVSRRSITAKAGGRYRALQNEDELINNLAARGFEIIEPEFMTFQEQIKVFEEAALVVGLGGAGLFNVIFCRPGTRVMTIESSATFVHGHALLFGSLGHRFAIVFGQQDRSDETPIHKRWTVDVAGVVRAITSF